MRLKILLCAAISLAGCATTTGIVPVGPNTYLLSEMRAPALGGGPEAQRAVLAEATAFCTARGLTFVPIFLRPDGDPTTPTTRPPTTPPSAANPRPSREEARINAASVLHAFRARVPSSKQRDRAQNFPHERSAHGYRRFYPDR